MRRSSLAAAASIFAGGLLLALPSPRTMWVVDDDGGPGVDFTDIPAALAAVPDDALVVVEDGLYSGFVIERPVVLVGASSARASASRIGAGQARVRLAGFLLSSLTITGSTNVLLDGVDAQRGSIEESNVRIVDSSFRPCCEDGNTGLYIHSSRVELADSIARGDEGETTTFGGYAEDGGSGIVVSGQSRIELSGTSAHGGRGGRFSSGTGYGTSGDGGIGIALSSGTTAVVRGLAGDTIRGGLGGYGGSYGDDGWGVTIRGGSSLRLSGAQVTGSMTILTASGSLDTPAIPDASLSRSGALTPGGGVVSYRVYAPSGSQVRLRTRYGACGTDFIPVPQAYDLGTVSGSSISRTFRVPPSIEVGDTLAVRALVRLPNGEIRATNEFAGIVR